MNLGGGGKQVIDGSGLPFLIEELVARSAAEIVIPDSTVAADFVDQLSRSLKGRVTVVSSKPAHAAISSMLEPLGEEIGARSYDPVYISLPERVTGIHIAYATLWNILPSFLLAMKHELQVDIEVAGVMSATDTIRRGSRNADTRALMAAIQGVFASYRPVEQAGAHVFSSVRGDLGRLLERLVQDEAYRRLSSSVHSIGIRGKGERALQLTRRLAEDLVSKEGFKRTLGFGTKTVETITSFPMPDYDLITQAAGAGYLPPVVRLKEAIANAHRLWQEQSPPFMSPDSRFRRRAR
jgi:hypothetical protein